MTWFLDRKGHDAPHAFLMQEHTRPRLRWLATLQKPLRAQRARHASTRAGSRARGRRGHDQRPRCTAHAWHTQAGAHHANTPLLWLRAPARGGSTGADSPLPAQTRAHTFPVTPRTARATWGGATACGGNKRHATPAPVSWRQRCRATFHLWLELGRGGWVGVPASNWWLPCCLGEGVRRRYCRWWHVGVQTCHCAPPWRHAGAHHANTPLLWPRAPARGGSTGADSLLPAQTRAHAFPVTPRTARAA